jgi:anion transporter
MVMNMTLLQKRDRAQMLKWSITAVAVIVSFFLPIPFKLQLFVAITVLAIFIWVFELLPEAVVGLFIPVLFVLFQVADANIAFSGWSSSTPWITVGGLMVGAAFLNSGLLKRIAYKMLILTGGTTRGLIIGLTLACIILAPIIPSVMAKVALMTPVVIGLCQALKIEPKSKTASALMLTVFLALWSPKMAFMTASADSVLAASILQQQYDIAISWFGWAKDMFVPAIFWTFVSVSLVFVLKPEKLKLDKSYLKAEYSSLGPTNIREKKAIVLAIVLILLLMTDTLHGIQPTWVMLIAGCSCFAPGMRLLESGDFNKLQFSIVFFLVGAVAIGSVATACGITDMIVSWALPLFEGKSTFQFIVVLWIFSVVTNFSLNPLALIAILTGPIAEACGALGYPEILGGYTMIMGFNQLLFPYQCAPLMLLYGFGYLKMGDLVKVMSVRIVVGFIFTIAITYPYWSLIGLIE